MSNFLLEEKIHTADELIKESKIEEASEILYGILEEAPDFGKAHNHLGFLFETKIKDLKKAEEHYKLALKFTKDFPAIYYNYAFLLSTLKRYEDLTALLEKAKKLENINMATIYNEYAIMYEAQGKYNQAIEAYKNAMRNSFDNKYIDSASASIERCQKKIDLLSPK